MFFYKFIILFFIRSILAFAFFLTYFHRHIKRILTYNIIYIRFFYHFGSFFISRFFSRSVHPFALFFANFHRDIEKVVCNSILSCRIRIFKTSPCNENRNYYKK